MIRTILKTGFAVRLFFFATKGFYQQLHNITQTLKSETNVTNFTLKATLHFILQDLHTTLEINK